jgi:hypothetical protein
VVVSEGDVHHGPGLDGAIDHHGTLRDVVHAQDGTLCGTRTAAAAAVQAADSVQSLQVVTIASEFDITKQQTHTH